MDKIRLQELAGMRLDEMPSDIGIAYADAGNPEEYSPENEENVAGVRRSTQERIDKVQAMEYDNALKLIFEWVKTNVINVKEFKELIQANRDAV